MKPRALLVTTNGHVRERSQDIWQDWCMDCILVIPLTIEGCFVEARSSTCFLMSVYAHAEHGYHGTSPHVQTYDRWSHMPPWC
jgi:hypothetical protein